MDVILVGGYVLHFPRTLAPPYSLQTPRRHPSPLACWILRACAMPLLSLGAHAPEGYGSCPVCVSVCGVSVRNLNLGTGASRGLNEGTSE